MAVLVLVRFENGGERMVFPGTYFVIGQRDEAMWPGSLSTRVAPPSIVSWE
jgi:hypothetical protein